MNDNYPTLWLPSFCTFPYALIISTSEYAGGGLARRLVSLLKPSRCALPGRASDVELCCASGLAGDSVRDFSPHLFPSLRRPPPCPPFCRTAAASLHQKMVEERVCCMQLIRHGQVQTRRAATPFDLYMIRKRAFPTIFAPHPYPFAMSDVCVSPWRASDPVTRPRCTTAVGLAPALHRTGDLPALEEAVFQAAISFLHLALSDRTPSSVP